MSAEVHQLYQQNTGSVYDQNTAQLYEAIVDIPNAEREASQLSVIEHRELTCARRNYDIVTYTPSNSLRTCNDAEGRPVSYPELLMVHGVASDARFFDSLFQKMNKLGIRCSAISLPRQKDVVPDGHTMLDWQVQATRQAYDHIKSERPDSHIILGGHSRGAIVATLAKKQLHDEHGSDADEGLLLLAPAGLDTYNTKSIGRAALNLLPLALNSLHHSDSKRLVGEYALMISQVIGANPSQTFVEVLQALRMNVAHDITDDLEDVSVFIPAADKDEFIDYQKIVKVAELAPQNNVSIATLSTNHMMGERDAGDVMSLSDPRILSGQILGWMQSQTVGYRPLAVNSSSAQILRLG
jgi:pimeloyl-ACP methyl ester carboxylesterase